ncbi:MAG: CoA-transferase [Thermodesulfobacteriota bacterium]
MSVSKLTTLSEGIDRLVSDGSSVAIGMAQETLIPFFAGHEIIRRKKRNLTLIGPISDILFDQLIGGNCVEQICAGWVGNVITGSCYNFRRAVENKSLKMEDHSNLTLTMALFAGAMGVPFMPTRTALGSDLYQTNSGLKIMSCPFTGETLTAVSAIRPDTAIIHVQRSDPYGNAHIWGNLAIVKEACMASRNILITAEEIVDSEIISSDPNRVAVPGFKVSAVVHAPWGAYPSPVPGYYNRDHQAFIDYRNKSKTDTDFKKWQAIWVDSVPDSDAYMARIGIERMTALSITHHVVSASADFGY